MAKAGPPIPFAVTSPADRVLPSISTPLRGRGWIDVQEVRIVETSQTLALNWSDLTTWETRLPADLVPGQYTLGVYDGRGDAAHDCHRHIGGWAVTKSRGECRKTRAIPVGVVAGNGL